MLGVTPNKQRSLELALEFADDEVELIHLLRAAQAAHDARALRGPTSGASDGALQNRLELLARRAAGAGVSLDPHRGDGDLPRAPNASGVSPTASTTRSTLLRMSLLALFHRWISSTKRSTPLGSVD